MGPESSNESEEMNGRAPTIPTHGREILARQTAGLLLKGKLRAMSVRCEHGKMGSERCIPCDARQRIYDHKDAEIARLREALERIANHEFTKLYEATDCAQRALKQ